jgi:hypothetical protein
VRIRHPLFHRHHLHRRRYEVILVHGYLAGARLVRRLAIGAYVASLLDSRLPSWHALDASCVVAACLAWRLFRCSAADLVLVET